MYAKWDIVLVSFPFEETADTKDRPAVVLGLHPPKGIVALAPITSQHVTLRGDTPRYEVLLTAEEAQAIGLRVASRIDMRKVRVLNASAIKRRIGTITAIRDGVSRLAAAASAWAVIQAIREGKIPGDPNLH
jgi:mRNA-degrading endonuclease toxin of MazEF toxin-antitoxin module